MSGVDWIGFEHLGAGVTNKSLSEEAEILPTPQRLHQRVRSLSNKPISLIKKEKH